MASKNLDFNTFDEQARLFKVLASPVRLEILRYLSKGPSCATLTNNAIKVSQPNLSQHLKALKDSGLIDCRIDGAKRCYFICRPKLIQSLLELLADQYPYEPCKKNEQK